MDAFDFSDDEAGVAKDEATSAPRHKVRYGVLRSLHGFPTWTATFLGFKQLDGLQEVYDLTVPGTENFIAAGITVHNCAQVFEKLSEEQYNVSKIRLAWADPKVQRANDYYQRALRAAPNDSYILYRYAQFFEKCQMEEQAEDFYLRSLEADSNNAASLQEYGNFLHEKGLADEAEKFFMRASANTRQDARATALNPKAKGLRID